MGVRMLKIKNLLALILINSFAVGPIVAARTPLPRSSVDAEEAPGVAGAGAGGGAGAAAGGSIDYAPAAIAEQGVLAKIELLRGTLAKAPTIMQGASLLHGAMLWELGIIKALYELLVTPETVPYKDSTRLVPASSPWPLGNILMAFFHLAGGTFQPTHSSLACAKYLKPDFLGALYAATVRGRLVSDESWPVTKRHYVKKWVHLSTSLKNLQQAFRECNEATFSGFNPKNLLPSIIMAFFWAKFVMGIMVAGDISIAIAQENIATFYAGVEKNLLVAPGGAGAAAEEGASEATSDLEAVENEVITRIKAIYHNSLPKPPQVGPVGKDAMRGIMDCSESTLLGLLSAAFYKQKSSSFVLPKGPEDCIDRYSSEVTRYFETYSTVAEQSTQAARDDWAEICSKRPGIQYGKDGWEVKANFVNIINLLVQLVPGACPDDCTCETELASKGAEAIGLTGVALHSQKCAQKILQKFAAMHQLSIVEFNESQESVSWQTKQLGSRGEDSCFLSFFVGRGHARCMLYGAIESYFGQINEPIFGGSDALSKMPENPLLIHPLILAAARMVNDKNFFFSYLSMRSCAMPAELDLLAHNIRDWGLMSPKEESLQQKKTLSSEIIVAVIMGLTNSADKIIDDNPEINLVDILMQAVTGRSLKVVQYLHAKAVDLNGRNAEGETVFDIARKSLRSLTEEGVAQSDQKAKNAIAIMQYLRPLGAKTAAELDTASVV
jgi:hypothetical protein